MQGTELVVKWTLCFASGGFHFSTKNLMSRLRGNECFGVWPKHNS